jgi:hypothetical protein
LSLTQQNPAGTAIRRALLALAAVVILGASIVPPCAVACCMTANVKTMHRAMPCCDDGAFIAPNDTVAAQPALTAAPFVPPATAVAHVVTPAAIATASLSPHRTANASESSPPFSVKASQLLI